MSYHLIANPAAYAIAESALHNWIVVIDAYPGVHDDLLVRCDDDVETDGEHEYWGTDDEGDPWRVHVRVTS